MSRRGHRAGHSHHQHDGGRPRHKPLRYELIVADGILPLWQCDDCFAQTRTQPLAHNDTGETARMIGPRCPECGCPMRLLSDV